MARIKTSKYEIEGQEVSVNYNCSSSGIFSTSLSNTLIEKLGLDDGKITGNSLSEIENVVEKAFIAYKEANTSYALKIEVGFGASGEFVKLPNGELNDKFFQNNKQFHLNIGLSSIRSLLGIDYRVLIEENRDGRISYHETIKTEKLEGERASWSKEFKGYCTTRRAHLGSGKRIIEYNETTLKNLDSITKQMQKASSFLVDTLSSENINLILGNSEFKAIEE